VFPELRCEPDGAIVREQKLKLASMNWLDDQRLKHSSRHLRCYIQFVDCCTLFIFSRYFQIAHVSHKIHTWAAETCGTKDAYPMRGRTDQILHHGPHQLNSAQDF
jgi:hypothetical protein